MSARDDLLEMLTAYTREMAGSDHMQSHAEEYARRDLDAYRDEVLREAANFIEHEYYDRDTPVSEIVHSLRLDSLDS